MKTICIHHRLGGYTSHHFNEAHGLMRELERGGRELVLLVNAQAPSAMVAELKAAAVLDDPTFRLEWSFEERSRRFRDLLHKRVDGLVMAGDCVLVTIATQLEAHALTCWLQELPRSKKPWIVIVFLSDRWNRGGRDEDERQIAEFRMLNATISSLAPVDARKLVFCAVTDLLPDELGQSPVTHPTAVPLPLPYRFPALSESARADSSLPRIAILGGTRREQGSHLIPA